MLSYRHEFHAGNYADVLKHAVLCQILAYMVKKNTPFLYLDTHAGAGVYDLGSDRANKTAEYRTGVAALLQHASPLPEALAPYIDYLKVLNPNGLKHYPGSPKLAQQWLRASDRMILCEKHPADFPVLQEALSRVKNVLCVQEDGFEKAFGSLPPKEKRGLVLIDPSYEVKAEYQWVADNLQKLLRRFATGVYAVWYPWAHQALTDHMINDIKQRMNRPLHRYEIGHTQDHSLQGMTGAGMLVVNPPWVLREAVAQVLPVLTEIMCPGGYWKCEVLVGEG